MNSGVVFHCSLFPDLRTTFQTPPHTSLSFPSFHFRECSSPNTAATVFAAVWCRNSPRASNPNTDAQDASQPYFLLKSLLTIQLWLTCLTSKTLYTKAVPSKLGCNQEFPGGPVTMTWHFHCHGLGLIPGQGTKIPQVTRHEQSGEEDD